MASFLPTDPKQQRVVMIGVAGLLAAILFWNFVYEKKMATVEEKETNVENITSELDNLKATYARNGGDLGKRIGMLEQHMKRMEQLIPQKQDVPNLLEAIAQEAVNANVLWGGVTPQPMEPTAYYTREVYDVMVSGTYHDIGQYLAGIASLPRIIKPKDMKLTVNANAKPRPDGLPMLTAAFSIETYVVPPPAPPAAAAAPGAAPADSAKAGT